MHQCFYYIKKKSMQIQRKMLRKNNVNDHNFEINLTEFSKVNNYTLNFFFYYLRV